MTFTDPIANPKLTDVSLAIPIALPFRALGNSLAVTWTPHNIDPQTSPKESGNRAYMLTLKFYSLDTNASIDMAGVDMPMASVLVRLGLDYNEAAWRELRETTGTHKLIRQAQLLRRLIRKLQPGTEYDLTALYLAAFCDYGRIYCAEYSNLMEKWEMAILDSE